MPDRIIRVLCVDDHPIVRRGIAQIVNLQDDMRVIAVAATGEEGLKLYDKHKPDVTLMDLQLPGMSGLETIRAIRHVAPCARIIVFTMYQGDEDIARALAAGAATYLTKDAFANELVRTIRNVDRGERPVRSNVAESLSARANGRTLSPREVEITGLFACGLRNKEIATRLGIAEDTVHGHVKSIFEKLSVNDRTAALVEAIRRGIVHI